MPSTNKTQIIGDATGGYTSVTTDASGKVVSTTPVKAGTGGGVSTKLLTPAEILQYQTDYPDAGIKIGDTATTAQSKANPVADYSKSIISGLNVTLPNGSVWTAPNQAALDQFKTDNKIGGPVASVASTPTSPLETKIASMKKSGILTDADIRSTLLQQGHTQAEINSSSIGSTLDKGLSALSSLFGKK
jgi:hypothetical protein